MNIIKDWGRKIKAWAWRSGERGKEAWGEAKAWFLANEKDLFIALVVILSSTLAYALGRWSRIEELRPPVTISLPDGASSTMQLAGEEGEGDSPADRRIVASKSGTRYYLPYCGGAKAIKLENRIYFDTEALAQAAGLSRAANCRDLAN